MAKRRLWIVWFALNALILGALGIQDRRDSYSCHICRARKIERTHSVWGISLKRSEREKFPGNPGVAQGHDWWRYSSSYANGPGGSLGRGVACRAFRYKDGTN